MYGESIGAIIFDFSDLERSISDLEGLYPHKGAELGHVLLLELIGNHIRGVQQHHHI